MSFLAPIFLAGAALVLFPIIFHLIKRTPRERRYFSSLLFLSPSPPRVTKKSRLENLLLLALRCLAICLLAFAFTRPYFKNAVALPTNAAQRNIVLLVDKSASMQQEGLWQKMLQQTDAELKNLGKSDRVAAYAFDRSLTPLLTLEEASKLPEGRRADAVSAKLKELKPGWAGTLLGNSIISAVELLNDPKQSETKFELVVISDFQEGAKLEGLQGYEWPKGWQIRLKQVKPNVQQNAGVAVLSEAKGTQLKVRVVNSPASKIEQFKLISPITPQEPPLDLYVPAGQSRTITVPSNLISGPLVTLAIKGDGNEFDNELRWVPPRGREVLIAHIGKGDIADPAESGYYLQRAFQNIDRNNFVITNYSSPAQLLTGKEDFAVFTTALDAGWAEGLREAARRGKVLLVALPEETRDVTKLFGATVGVEEVKHGKYGMLGYIDFQHPLFAPFSDPRFSDFTKISFWKYRKLTGLPEETRVFARFDNKDPAIIELTEGNGKILVFTTTWKPADSQLALSSKFVPLLYSALALNGTLQQSQANWLVGDLVQLPKGATSVQQPDGSTLPSGELKGEFVEARLPGIYAFLPGMDKVAVNLSPDESRTSPMFMDEFKRLGLPLDESGNAANVKSAAIAGAIDLENKQKLWRWILLAVVLVLLVETIVAGRLSRQVTAPA